MTNQLTSKFSLYDILSMILPGCVWLWVIKSGLNIDVIAIVKENGLNSEIWAGVAFLAIAYILGLVGGALCSFIWSILFANKEWQIKWAKKETHMMVEAIPVVDIEQKFYIAYEYVRQKSVNIEVFSIESQVGLLRNIAVPLSILIGIMVSSHLCICASLLIAFVCFCLLVFAMLLCQIHRYQLVFDCYEYMKRLEHLDLCKFE